MDILYPPKKARREVLVVVMEQRATSYACFFTLQVPEEIMTPCAS
jgi:hypothetical protein